MTETVRVLNAGSRLRRAALHPVTVTALMLTGAVTATAFAATGRSPGTALPALGCAGLLAGYANSGST